MSIEEIRHDIALAQRAITNSELTLTASADRFLCEIYHLPSHNQSTIYARIYERSDQVVVVYARTEIYSLGWKVFHVTFEQTQDSNQHGGSKGCIICGSKYLADYSVSEIFENIDKLQKISIPKVKGFVLDDESFYLSSGNTNCLFAGSCSDLSFDGKENVLFFIRLVKSILGNDCHRSMCER